jgi:small GTP-binding protein|tara:strand:+ start:1982 stop:2485 length:504 start_codon:yes stop_codon:yes gene_type:complete
MTTILLLGDQRVGKSSWLKRFTNEDYHDSYIATIGKQEKEVYYKKRLLKFIDIGGYERYHNILSFLSIHSADGAILFYDVNNEKSYKRISYWKDKLPKDTPYVIVGNKSDLLSINEHMSCKENINIKHPVDLLIKEMSLPEDPPTILTQLLEYFFYWLPTIRLSIST